MPRKMKKDFKDKKKKKGFKFGVPQGKRWCRYCVNKELKIDYKEGRFLAPFISERGKIISRKYAGLCAKHQRDITIAIKRARQLAIVPYTATQVM